jgi:hypothetical protein
MEHQTQEMAGTPEHTPTLDELMFKSEQAYAEVTALQQQKNKAKQTQAFFGPQVQRSEGDSVTVANEENKLGLLLIEAQKKANDAANAVTRHLNEPVHPQTTDAAVVVAKQQVTEAGGNLVQSDKSDATQNSSGKIMAVDKEATSEGVDTATEQNTLDQQTSACGSDSATSLLQPSTDQQIIKNIFLKGNRIAPMTNRKLHMYIHNILTTKLLIYVFIAKNI